MKFTNLRDDESQFVERTRTVTRQASPFARTQLNSVAHYLL